MRKILLALIASGVLAPAVQAQNDPQFLSWEHSLTTRSPKSRHPFAKAKIFNNWTNGKHRLLVKYNVSGMGASNDFIGRTYGTSFSMPNFDPSRLSSKVAYHNGALGIVQDLEADKLVVYSSEAGEHGEYFSEDRKALMKRLRFDPWKKIAPELSREEVPQLTGVQRARLGREVRAVLQPVLRNVVKTYFRALPQTREFDAGGEKIKARGYRLTALLNAGGFEKDAQWMRLAFEWWLAPQSPDDVLAQRFLGQLVTDYRELGGPTTSMWMNETLPLMWASMPKELHHAMNTLLPLALDSVSESTPLLALGGTPVYAAATVLQSKPKMGKCPDCGQYHVPLRDKNEESMRVELRLNQRSSRELAPAVFAAPTEYEEQQLEPVLEMWEQSIEMLQGAVEEEMQLSALPGHSSKGGAYTWRALKEYTRKANALMQRAR